jgi:hypothetical protein
MSAGATGRESVRYIAAASKGRSTGRALIEFEGQLMSVCR